MDLGLSAMQTALVILLVRTLSGRPRVAEHKQTSTHAGKHQTSGYEAVVPPMSAVIDQPPRPCSEKDPCWTKDASPEKSLPRFLRPEWVIVYITVLYAFIAWLTLIAIKRQANTMDQQSKDARDSAASAALVTEETLAALKRQADAMDRQNNAIRDREKPRLSVTLEAVSLRVEVPFVRFSLICYGPSPAFITLSWVGVVVSERSVMNKHVPMTDLELPHVFRESEKPQFDWPIRGTGSFGQFTRSDADSRGSGHSWLHFQVNIFFDDVFGNREFSYGRTYGATSPPIKNFDGTLALLWMHGPEDLNKDVQS